MKTRLKIFTSVLSVLACCAFLPQMQAVVPAPDGCYPGFTTAEGCRALESLTTGTGNTGLGFWSLILDTTGLNNTGVGAQSLAMNNGDLNTAVGVVSLVFNLTGSENTAVGAQTLPFNDGNSNGAFGAFALFNNIDGSNNNAFGEFALVSNEHGIGNSAFGDSALASNTNGGSNTAVGSNALASNDIGNSNTAVGVFALPANVSGIENTAVGGAALFTNVDGSHNIAVGQAALSNNTSGSNNIAVGEFAGLAVTTSNNVIAIGVQGQDISDSCFIGNIFNAMAPSGSAVFIDANNRLGTNTSSKRFKEDIKPIGKSSEALLELKPVTFRYKKEIDPAARSQFGLVAEEVEKVNPDLVVRDKEGKPYSVRYDQVNAMLLNEFLKEHREVQELKKQVEALTAGLQKVSDELELRKPAPRTVVNNH
jgi:trimeric autotransporter adhesin